MILDVWLGHDVVLVDAILTFVLANELWVYRLLEVEALVQQLVGAGFDHGLELLARSLDMLSNLVEVA